MPIYEYDKINNRGLQLFAEKYPDEASVIADFVKYLKARGCSQGRVYKYIYTLKTLRSLLNKPFKDVAKDDLIYLFDKLSYSDYKENTIKDFKVTLKMFYRWLYKTDDYPDLVKWLKATVKKNKELPPESILTKEEVMLMANVASNTRDRALILVLYESGCRIGELLNLKIKDVVFDTYGCYLLATGKTGWRRVRLIEFSGDLLRWLDQHPKKQDQEAWVWINLERLDDVVSVSRVNSMLKELAKKVGIRKRVNPHSFRHARATHLARHLPEAVMKKFFGWSNDSKMAAVYYHLSGRDVDEALLKLNGIEISRGESEDKKVKVCQKCGYANSLLSHFCIKCNSPLDYKLIEIDRLAERFDEFLKEFFIYYSQVDLQFKKVLVSFVRDKGYEDLFEL